jgi:drug/metabolite transporter (DMT)-like permease
VTQHAAAPGKQLAHSLWMLFAAFVFAIMSMCVKLAGSLYSTSEIVMYRGAVGMVILSLLVLHQGGSLRTTMPRQHLWRGAVGVTALWLWFYAISQLPLATANTLNYMAPIWIATILFVGGWWHSKKHLEWPLVAAIAMSFVGVTLLLQPVFHARQWTGAVMGLASGVLSALAYLQVRRLGRLGEPEYRVVFYFSLVTLIAGLLGTTVGATVAPGAAWHAHSAYGVALLLAIGLSAAVAQMAMTRAYRLGKTLVVANLQYTGIVFSSMWGMLVWGDRFDWHGWLGMGVILFSGIAATFYNNRNTAPASVPTDPIASEL